MKGGHITLKKLIQAHGCIIPSEKHSCAITWFSGIRENAYGLKIIQESVLLSLEVPLPQYAVGLGPFMGKQATKLRNNWYPTPS